MILLAIALVWFGVRHEGEGRTAGMSAPLVREAMDASTAPGGVGEPPVAPTPAQLPSTV